MNQEYYKPQHRRWNSRHMTIARLLVHWGIGITAGSLVGWTALPLGLICICIGQGWATYLKRGV